jgi:DNA-binding NtrC family response regulator
MHNAPRILVLDASATAHDDSNRVLSECGYDVEVVRTGEEGIARFRRSPFDVVLTEHRLPDMDAFEVLARILAIDARAKVIVLTGNGSVRLAVDAVKAGAYYFIKQPVEPERLRLLVARAVDAGARRLSDGMVLEDRYVDLIGRSRSMQEVFAMVEAVAESDANILIVGESGTGKELVANAIHARSLRARHAFVKINCSALPSELIENELFGHVRGAFTGADADKQGLIGSATGGSLLLDEIGEMPIDLQPKLLRVLQERQYVRLGSERPFKADFRLISSTNQPPEDAVQAGRLREDLYYRLSTITIVVPPLRERVEDIGLLANHMLERFSGKYAKQIAGFSPAAYAAMMDYAWPGNVRELENVIERAVLLTHGATVGMEMLSHVGDHHASHGRAAEVEPGVAGLTDLPVVASHDIGLLGDAEPGLLVPSDMTLAEIERSVIFQTLRQLRGNKKAAAKCLGIYRRRLYAKIKQYNLIEFMAKEPSSLEPREAVVGALEDETATTASTRDMRPPGAVRDATAVVEELLRPTDKLRHDQHRVGPGEDGTSRDAVDGVARPDGRLREQPTRGPSGGDGLAVRDAPTE